MTYDSRRGWNNSYSAVGLPIWNRERKVHRRRAGCSCVTSCL